MDKALFTRKAVDVEELKRRTGEERDKVPFVIEKVIELTEDQFKEVCNNLLDDYDFLEEATDLMYVDKNGVWHVVLVKAIDGIESVITAAEGYGYFRYSSYIPDCTELLRKLNGPITDKIFEQLMDIRSSGTCNMFDTVAVQNEAYRRGFFETVILIEEHKKEYAKFIMTGER